MNGKGNRRLASSPRIEDDILFAVKGGVATVTLNRPQALNAFTLDMYRRFDPRLRDWAEDPAIHAVLIRGAGERAFCAGGDVRAVYEAGLGIAGDPALTADFFLEEYRLIRRIHRFTKPVLALIDGITMGGGAGISVNGTYCIATERTTLAMPETGIGLFPDVAATRFLDLCPGEIGRYLGLTGVPLGAADALYCRLATDFVPRKRIAGLAAALCGLEWQSGNERCQVRELLPGFITDPGLAPLAARREAIDRAFAGDTVEAILEALSREAAAGGADAEWASETRALLLTKSPTSLKITLRQLTLGRGYDIEAALALEYRLTQHVMQGHDFYEGVRAALIDRDHRPRWQPATLAEVDEAMVDRYFAPLAAAELDFAC